MPKTELKKVIRRKKSEKVENLNPEQRYNLLKDYSTGDFDFGQLADKYQLKDKEGLRRWVNQHINALNIVKETSALNPKTQTYYKEYQPNNLINEPFLKLLSPADALELTDAEVSYCYLIVFAGNELEAFEESGLDAGLTKYKSKGTRAYQHAIRMRGIFLRAKSNVKKEVGRLRERKYSELTKDIGKEWVINELVDMAYQLKESGQNPKLLLDTIEKIGKTCGAFVERVQVEGISAASKLDQLVAQAQEEVTLRKPPEEMEEYQAEDITVQ